MFTKTLIATFAIASASLFSMSAFAADDMTTYEQADQQGMPTTHSQPPENQSTPPKTMSDSEMSQKLFEKADQDKDGSVSKDEFGSIGDQSQFGKVDTNADGKVSSSEIEDAVAMQNQH